MSGGTLDAELATEMETALADVCCSRDGVATLVDLLASADERLLQGQQGRAGLVALLDGVRARLDLACDGLRGAALQLGVAVAPG